jgi:fermentation-respiration switch protein FrsA (DUF1100 family)
LRGWFYGPEKSPAPLVVMAHGLSGVKEMYLDAYAEVFAKAGLASVVFDHAGFGESDGEPRQTVDPPRQLLGYRDAITFGSAQPGVNGDAIGVWGSSFSGGHVIVLAATDDRVKAAVSQVPYVGVETPPAPEDIPPVDPREWVPATSPVGGDGLMQTDDSHQWFTSVAAARAPRWRNQLGPDTRRRIVTYRPVEYATRIKIPFLMIVSEEDALTPAGLAIAACKLIKGSELKMIPGAHFGAYEEHFDASSGLAAEFFRRHLGGDSVA